MSEWICAKCGELAHSKCPHQRSIFPENELASMLKQLMFHKVIQTSEDSYEVFISYTLYAKDLDKHPLLEVMDRLNANMARGTLQASLCDHFWVKNSETDRKCDMGCTEHKNLSDRADILTKLDKGQADLRPQGIFAGFSRFINDVMYVMASKIRRPYTFKDNRIWCEDEAEYLRNRINRELTEFQNKMPEEKV